MILLSHEKSVEVKDRLGRTSTYYQPQLDDKTLDLLSGSGFSLRAYWESNTSEKNVKTMQRMLSMGSTPDWFGVTRFAVPVEQTESIPLDYNLFEEYMKYHNAESEVKPKGVIETPISLKKQNVSLPNKVDKVNKVKKEEPTVSKEEPTVTKETTAEPEVKTSRESRLEAILNKSNLLKLRKPQLLEKPITKPR